MQIITEWPGFSRENYTKLQNGLALVEKLQTITKWPGFSRE